MRIVMLIENTAVSQKLLVEHGMSVYIEKILAAFSARAAVQSSSITLKE